MSLYSYQGSYPVPVPYSITLSSGFTRTDPTTFTQEELEDAGYTGPYLQPPFDSRVETLDWDGNDFIVRPYNNGEIQKKWKEIRTRRTELLEETDWMVVSDYDFNIFNIDAWISYRQILRDIPQVQTNPFDISWPLVPVG